jgi:murein DD-endopeptidase MepM/ murein hydrolase activator NlpD
MRKLRVAIAFVLAIVAPVATAGWPPEPLVEMRVPVAPSAFPSAGRTYLVYEIRLTNQGRDSLVLRRLDLRDADHLTAEPIATYEGEPLDKVLQHFGNPAVGDRMPEADGGHRNLAAGETAIVFLTVVLERGARVPDRLRHRLYTSEGNIDGAIVSTHAYELRILSPPLEGTSWQALSGAGDNKSHHRRQFMVLGGRVAQDGRHAIDWKRTVAGASFSGHEGEIASYYSYGRRVLAVANGTVVRIKDGIPDNKPGHVGAEALDLSLETIAGNTIALDLGHGQFAHYMHLKPGSLRVKVGQRVRRGEAIALVGSSGSSFEPHLHFEVTTSPVTAEGEGLPYLLDDYEAVVDGVGERRHRELPTRGTIVNFSLAASPP